MLRWIGKVSPNQVQTKNSLSQAVVDQAAGGSGISRDTMVREGIWFLSRDQGV